MKHSISIAFILLIFCITKSYAALSNEIPSDASSTSQWTMGHANSCLVEDNTHRISANGECIALQTYSYNNTLPKPKSRLLIFIHGDGIPGGSPADYFKYQATKHLSSNTVAIVLIRPGYYDSLGNYSTGESHAFDCDGAPCDGYRPRTVATLVATISKLKSYYQPQCTILVGHSGGAIMSAIILGKYPNLVQGAVLASTTNDVHQWASKHHWGEWTNSLSPHEWVSKIPEHSNITVVSGDADTDTYPDMAHQYYNKLIQTDHQNSRFINVKGGTHNSIVQNEAVELNRAIEDALSKCH